MTISRITRSADLLSCAPRPDAAAMPSSAGPTPAAGPVAGDAPERVGVSTAAAAARVRRLLRQSAWHHQVMAQLARARRDIDATDEAQLPARRRARPRAQAPIAEPVDPHDLTREGVAVDWVPVPPRRAG
jgi:hypothetical protein